MATDLLRLLKDSPEHGLKLTDLPQRLLDPDSLTVLAGDGLVEFGYAEDEATISRGELISVERWNWSSWIGPGSKPIGQILREIFPVDWSELMGAQGPVDWSELIGSKYHVRLTSKGRIEASRTKSEAPPGDQLLDLDSDLSALERRLVRYLLVRRKARLDDLIGPDRPWRVPVTPDAQRKAIQRLNLRLLEKLNSPISVSIKGGIVVLDRPPDK